MKLVTNIKLGAFLLIIGLLFACNMPKEQTAEKQGDFQIKKYHYQQADSLNDYFEVAINYFQIIGDYDFANVINNVILDEYQGMAEGNFDNPNILLDNYFSIQAAEIDTLIREMGIDNFAPYTFKYDAELVLNNDSIFTFVQSFYEYTGGAHGNYSTIYSNYFIKTIDKIELKDLFTDDDLVILTKMGEASFRKAQEIPENKSLKDMGYELENGFYLTSNFLLTKKGIKFYYPPYEIACYAIGDSGFELSYKSIKDKLLDAKLYTYIN